MFKCFQKEMEGFPPKEDINRNKNLDIEDINSKIKDLILDFDKIDTYAITSNTIINLLVAMAKKNEEYYNSLHKRLKKIEKKG